MRFNSFEFLLFFPLVTGIYFIIPHKFRTIFLLIASCIFYMAFIPRYILILFFVIIVDYLAGLLIASSHGQRRRFYLLFSILANVGTLIVFKYFNFLGTNLTALAHLLNLPYTAPALNLILPIGLSFHTFQAMSYTIEVYRGKQRPEKNLLTYALYVMFYPQLVAGPIERPYHMLPQFHQPHRFSSTRVVSGLRLMLWGLFKKIVVADRLALWVNPVYDQPTSFAGLPLILATVFFSFQIYYDFSAYSDIAIGAARVMGFKLMSNFNRPYSSTSVADFWRRWHISLSTWFRDYLYIPLGGSLVGPWHWRLNILITFLISGLWHGANWTFIIWGGLHGAYIIIGKKLRLPRILRLPTTFALTCLAWIFFRAKNLNQAWYIVTHLFSGFTIQGMNLSWLGVFMALGMILIVELASLIRISRFPIFFRWATYYALIFGILFFGIFNNTPFIYFQF